MKHSRSAEKDVLTQVLSPSATRPLIFLRPRQLSETLF